MVADALGGTAEILVDPGGSTAGTRRYGLSNGILIDMDETTPIFEQLTAEQGCPICVRWVCSECGNEHVRLRKNVAKYGCATCGASSGTTYPITHRRLDYHRK